MENVITNDQNKSNFPIKPEEFWTELSKVLNARWTPEVEASWKSKPRRTDFMHDAIESLETKFGCISEDEYLFRVDISFIAQEKKCGHWDKWSWEAAVEVENEDHWRDEVCKLMHINAGIKVVVAYVNGPESGALDSFWKELPEIYKSRKYLTHPCNWLFVFGIFGGDLWDFKAYKFDGKTHTDITGKDRTRPLPI